jgi:outer membrane autotransporter protein
VSNEAIINEAGGTITGGNGGGGKVSTVNAVPTSPGEGGAGIKGSGVSVINAGTITGGSGGTGTGWTPVAGDAVLFTGGVNSLEIWSTSHLNGNAVAFSAADTLKLGGATNASFDVSQIGAKGSAAQYQGFGVFEKTGTSTWTLTGTTTAVTPWTLTGGVLQIASDGNLGDASGALTFNGGTLENTASLSTSRNVTLAANGTLLTDTGTTLTLNGTIAGTGALTKNGAGTLVLGGDNGYSGGTTIGAGTLQIGNGGASGSIVGDVVNNGALVVDRSGALTLDGAISGTGSVTQAGSGTAILAGNNSYTGGTRIASGTLQLGNGGASGSIVGDVIDNGTLAFNRSDTLVFDNAISGSGAVNQAGAGTTILNAASTYGGGTNVLAGTLAVGDPAHRAASLSTGLTTVAAGATLGGYGSVSGSVNNHGTLAVANALQSFATAGSGTLRIGGDLNNAGVVNLAAASRQTGNVLNVGGNYVGTNGQLVLNAVLNQGGTITQGDRLVVGANASGTTALRLNASSSGAATSGDGIQLVQVNGTSAANAFRLAGPVQAGAYQYLLYQGGTADVNSWYLRSQLEQAATGSTSPSGTTGSTSALASAPIAYRPAVTGYAVTPLLVTDYGFTMLGRLHERVGDVTSVEAATQSANRNGVWGRIGGQNLDADAGDRFSADERTFFAQFGKDWTLSRGENGGSTHAGATVTFGSTSASFADSARGLSGQLSNATGTVETQAQSVGGYWTKYLPDGTYFDGVGQLTHYQNQYGDVYGGSGRQNGFGAGVSVEAGKPFALGASGVAIEPQAQLLYQYVHLNHFNDGISDVGANTTNALRGRLGFRLFKANLSNDAKNSTLTPYLSANVLHDFFSPGQARVGDATLQNELGKTWYEIGVGLTGSFGKSSAVYANVSYAHSIGGEYRRTVFGQAGYRFSW